MIKNSHALFSPSSADKWFNCAASLAMEIDFPEITSKYSMEGSAAHKIAEKILKNILFLKKNKNKKRKIKAIQYLNSYPLSNYKNKKIGPIVTQEMTEYIQIYVDNICQFAKEKKLFIEQRVDFSEFISIDKQYGTADAIIISNDQMQIHDLKYGFIKVNAKENKQLQLYALGALKKFDKIKKKIKIIEFFIHQPRLNYISKWKITVENLILFSKKAKLSAIYAMFAINLAQNKGINQLFENMFNPGFKQCRWCRASGGKCKAETIYYLKSIDKDFKKNDEIKYLNINKMLNNIELSKLYVKIGELNKFFKSIKKRVIEELNKGNNIPGLKLTYNKSTPRTWINESLAKDALKKIILRKDDLYIKKLVSPAKAEKIINKKFPQKWESLKHLIIKPQGKLIAVLKEEN